MHRTASGAPNPPVQVLNSVLAEICWGRVERGDGAEQAPSWIWDGVSSVTVNT